MEIGIVLVLGLVCIVALTFRTQSKLAPLRERIDEGASNIKVCIQKRNRLIKQLIDIAATYARHEKELHERVSADFNSPTEIARNPKGALAYVSRLINTFPELRADRTYSSLTSDLNALESELQNRHEQHNASVREYNSVRLSFPNDFFGSLAGFEVAGYLDGTDPVTSEPKKTESERAAELRRVPPPRRGMKFRDTPDDSLAEICDVEADSVRYAFIPPRNRAPDGRILKGLNENATNARNFGSIF